METYKLICATVADDAAARANKQHKDAGGQKAESCPALALAF